MVKPDENGVVLAAELGGPGSGVVSAVGDQGEGKESFAGAWVGGVEGEVTEVFERLTPLLDFDAYHDEDPDAMRVRVTPS